jgi:hypothetical protein
MDRLALAFFSLLLALQDASGATVTGNKALALASLVAENSPILTPQKKRIMKRLLEGDLNISFPKNKKISIKADVVDCHASNVEITFHSCKLTFGTRSARLKARKAHELFATMAEAGVPEDGAAGRVFETLSHLVCTIDPNEIKEGTGGGADCQYDPGASTR